ncbi:MAG: hypothetical protein A2359_01700 [Candidatus Moranbacteria bacterium RIFOXYB1_FULL_43_19]|nr:MAG: hypothetical protein A2359_01700 [Candidatus Moranbacteria bacterium RIFOXYB1_FULL_43_19]OGI27964.1 MAG: hypothetical protein A2184_02595 [Candidatus Moranbacteria bacterium RIFOXYA1_FULL_44_7]OGI32615.1 MAG: hypothetical protein A2420_01280 [Candidatus Moranbacteria bacterium RIFOXYC1_FULL_44_13]OGI37848.1 MAG: hypothetical protein A2612_05500 [Candidatus Moranbacteria bacterium RIFOXYD1_FULL_44_12]
MKTRKSELKKKIFATLVIVFMLAMMGGMISLKNVRAIGDDTTLQQVLTGGSLSLESPTQVNFNSQTAGSGANSLANLTQVNMRDYTGTGGGWAATATANAMTAANAATIPNTRLSWAPGDIYALDGASNDGVTAGPDYSGNFGDGARNLTGASSGNGMGNYVINGTTLNLLIIAEDYQGTYQNTLTLTIA